MQVRFRIIWEVGIIIAVFIAGMLVPMTLAIGNQNFAWIFSGIMLLFLIDFASNTQKSRSHNENDLSFQSSSDKTHNIRWLIIDLIAVVSLAISTLYLINTAGSTPTPIILASLLPLLKLFKLDKLFDDLQDKLNINPSFLRLLIFIFWIFLASHLIALGWILIGAIDTSMNSAHQYTSALYWSVTTLTTVGYGDITPDMTSIPQVAFTMLVMLLGVAMYGYIIGNVSTLITNIDAAKAHYLEKMEEVNLFLKTRKVPPELQDRVRNYYRYLWKTHKTTNRRSLLDELPHTLEVDLALFLNQNILQKVPYFSDADDLFIREIVQRMELLVFLPGDYIIRQGEFGEAMYFLSSGAVDVIINGEHVITRKDGSFFGETSLLRNMKRNASILATTYCDVYRLSKHDFDDLRDRFPDFNQHIISILTERENID